MHYADSSFMVSLIMPDAATEAATAAFRAMGRRQLIFTDIHEMEVRNTIRRVEYQQTLELPAKLRSQAAEYRQRAMARLETYIQRHIFVRSQSDWRSVMDRFANLSETHTSRLGCRTFDTLHVAFALEARCESFITGDARQAALAKVCGLKVLLIEVGD